MTRPVTTKYEKLFFIGFTLVNGIYSIKILSLNNLTMSVL